MAWGDDVEDSEEDEQDEESGIPEIPDFPKTFEKAVRGSGSITDFDEEQLENQIDEIDDIDLLKEAWMQAGGPRRETIESQIHDLGGDVKEKSDASSEKADDESAEEEDEDDSDEEESSDGGWGSSDDDDSEEAPEPSVESVEDMEDDDAGESKGSAQNESSGDLSDSGGPPVPENSITVKEAADRDRRWKIMVWGPPKLFKTHFCYTMPEPIAFIDLEGKADDIASKFAGKEIQVWQPKDMTANPDTKFRRAKKALDEALEWLDWHRENNGEIGSIVVDSMSLMWEWAQVHHKLENYPLKDEEEIDLSSNFNSSQESDWAVIKEYHNGEFRERITDSPYHFCWTAMERVDFEQTFEEGSDQQIMEPTGEPKNTYKADTIIHARKDPDRGKVGDLTGSNFTDNVFVGMEKPTFPKVSDAIERIQGAESSDNPDSRSEISDQIDAAELVGME